MKINEIITEGKTGLWANIRAKKERGAKMRKKGAPGAPTDAAFKAAQAGSKNESVQQGVAEAAGSPSFRKGQKVLIVKQGVIATVTKIDKKWGYITVQTNDGRMAQIDERQFNQIKAYHGPMLSPSVTSEITELLNNGTSPDDVADIMSLPVEVVAEFMPNQQGVAEGYFDDEDNEPPYHTRILDRQTKKVIADEGPYETENEAVDRAEAYLAWAKTKDMSIVAQVYQPEHGKNYVTWQVPDGGDYTVKEQGVAEGSTNDYFKRRKDEEDRIAGTKAPAKRTPRQTDYAKRRSQEKKIDQLEETYDNDDEFFEAYGVMEYNDEMINESEYQGRKVTLNKPMQGDVKKFKVYTKNEKGNVVKVNFGDPNSTIKKNNPARRKSFRARHNCDNPGPKTGARYWSCRKW